MSVVKGPDDRLNVWFISPQGSDPKLTAKDNCRYEVEWVTEYACHRDYLQSRDCKLTSKQHDISIDLTHLTHGGKSRGGADDESDSA